jgi:hypothetical protein
MLDLEHLNIDTLFAVKSLDRGLHHFKTIHVLLPFYILSEFSSNFLSGLSS